MFTSSDPAAPASSRALPGNDRAAGASSLPTGSDASAYRLIYEDDFLLVLEKPSGLLCVPGRGPDKQDCLSSRVQRDFADALVVHRLDMSTSGLLVMARGREVQGRLGHLFQTRRVDKTYIAIVVGRPSPDVGEIDLPLASDWENRPRQRVDFVLGKAAQTRYRVVSHDKVSDTSRLELAPLTGRTHQLRVHLQSIGHPIVGDALYMPTTCEFAGRLLLHANALSFAHPATGASLQFVSPPQF